MFILIHFANLVREMGSSRWPQELTVSVANGNSVLLIKRFVCILIYLICSSNQGDLWIEFAGKPQELAPCWSTWPMTDIEFIYHTCMPQPAPIILYFNHGLEYGTGLISTMWISTPSANRKAWSPQSTSGYHNWDFYDKRFCIIVPKN